MEYKNKFEITLDHIKKNGVPQYSLTDGEREHALVIQEALEKQVPQKVYSKMEPLDFGGRHCPVCGGSVLDTGLVQFCKWCGQALKY